MYESGIRRRIDNLGRCVIPNEIRKLLGIEYHDEVDIFQRKNEVIIRPVKLTCCSCGDAGRNMLEVSDGSFICRRCAEIVVARKMDEI